MPEVKFISDNKNTIMAEAIKSLRTRTNFTNLSPGGKARTIAEVLSDVLAYQVGRIRVSQAVNLLSYATGDYLDALGEILNIPRYISTTSEVSSYHKSVRLFTIETNFGAINSNVDIFIPEGTEVYSSKDTGQERTYEISEDTILPALLQEKYISVRAKIVGTAANLGERELNRIAFTNYTDYLNESLEIENVAALNYGRDKETDQNYRFRIANQAANLATANEISIRLAALSIPGVMNVLIDRYTHGVGTSTVTVLSTTRTVPDYLIAAVEAEVRNVEASGNRTYIEKPKETGVAVELTLYFDSSVNVYEVEQIEQAVSENIDSYVNSIEIGDSLRINTMASVVMGTDSRIKDMGTEGKPFDAVYIYKTYRPDNTRIKRRISSNYYPTDNEILFMETSLSSPITITSVVK